MQRVRPLLTPLAVDAGRPFPQISAHSLNLLAVVQQEKSFDLNMPSCARLKVPRKVPRLIELGAATAFMAGGNGHEAHGGPRTFVLSEDIVRAYVQELFPGVQVVAPFAGEDKLQIVIFYTFRAPANPLYDALCFGKEGNAGVGYAARPCSRSAKT